MNIRSSSELIGGPDDEYNNILYKETKPGTKVEILEFKNEPTKSGFYWCKVKTKSTPIMLTAIPPIKENETERNSPI